MLPGEFVLFKWHRHRRRHRRRRAMIKGLGINNLQEMVKNGAKNIGGKTARWWWQRKHLRAIFGFACDFCELEIAGLQYRTGFWGKDFCVWVRFGGNGKRTILIRLKVCLGQSFLKRCSRRLNKALGKRLKKDFKLFASICDNVVITYSCSKILFIFKWCRIFYQFDSKLDCSFPHPIWQAQKPNFDFV